MRWSSSVAVFTFWYSRFTVSIPRRQEEGPYEEVRMGPYGDEVEASLGN